MEKEKKSIDKIIMDDYSALNPKAKQNMVISTLVVSTITFIILFAIRAVLLFFKLPQPVIFWFHVFMILIGMLSLLTIFLGPTVGYSHLKYRINEESVEYISGIFFLKHEIIPTRRMQQINISQGPINKLFNLSEIEVVTAGSNMLLKYLHTDEANIIAEKLKNDINEFALIQSREVENNEI